MTQGDSLMQGIDPQPPSDPGLGTLTSATFKYYTGLQSESKSNFYGRAAPDVILALHMEIDLFTAAERPKRFLAII